MLLQNSGDTSFQYFIRIANGQEVGPFATFQQAQASAVTLPVIEGVPPQVFPRTSSGQQFLLG